MNILIILLIVLLFFLFLIAIITNNVCKSKVTKEEKKNYLIFISLILFSLFAPYIFTRPIFLKLFNFYDKSATADTIYGLTGPFIAIAAALLTYFAFKEQIKANALQKKATNNQIKKDEITDFENKLFQMIDYHRENVSSLKFSKKWNNDTVSFEGDDAINALEYTLNVIIDLINNSKYNNSFEKKEKQILAYLILVHGPSLVFGEYFNNSDKFKKYSKKSILIIWIIKSINMLGENKTLSPIDGRPYYLKNEIDEISQKKILNINQNYMDYLSRFFRQIYQIYVFIDKQSFLNRDQKEYYAKMVRTSISNYEQELLFNDIISPYGEEWEKKNLVMNYKPFKNVTKYTKYAYTPKDYFQESEHYVEPKKLGDYIDILNYI